MARYFQRISLKSPIEYYTNADTAIHIPNLREQYRQLRKVENERLRAMEKAGLTDTRTYQFNKGRYEAPSTLSDAEIAARMPDLARAIMSKGNTVGGIRQIAQKQIETLKDENEAWNFLNKKNAVAFQQFMDDMKNSDDENRWYDEVSEMEDDEQRILTIQERFEMWLDGDL